MDKFPNITKKLRELADYILEYLDSQYYQLMNIITIRIMDISSPDIDILLEYNRLRNLLDKSIVDIDS